jgi:hypothetical protein
LPVAPLFFARRPKKVSAAWPAHENLPEHVRLIDLPTMMSCSTGSANFQVLKEQRVINLPTMMCCSTPSLYKPLLTSGEQSSFRELMPC